MTDAEIVEHVKRLFQPQVSPGQAFDALFKMRQERVLWSDVVRAISFNDMRAQALDEQEVSELAPFECPRCGVSRTNPDYCIVPGCPDYRPNPTTGRIKREAAPPKFQNPVFDFGKYNGRTMLEVCEINPEYVAWLARECSRPFWKEQARLAQVSADTTAPIARDTSSTGFFD